MYVLLNFMNIDNFIAKKNIDRYFGNQSKTNFDINYLCDLGTDATGEMVKLLQSEDEYIVKKVNNYLLNQKENLRLVNNSWQEYNISKENARKILEDCHLKSNYYE